MASLDRIALFDRLDGCRRVLIAGAGGGFDIYAGVPLHAALRRRGVEVHLANLSFTNLASIGDRAAGADRVHVRVTADTTAVLPYFPEKHLAAWFRSRGEEVVIHAMAKVGVRPLRAAYAALIAELGIDAVVLVDGGTDSLMRGDEAGLGTPVEDMSSIVAVDGLDVPVKLLAAIGFGIDHFHGVQHIHVLEAIAELTRAGAYLGAFAMHPPMPELAAYVDAVAHSVAAMPHQPSIVNTSIAAAAVGEFGDVHATSRTRGSELFINPLMALYFAFELGPVAARLRYRDLLEGTDTAWQVACIIEAFQDSIGNALRKGRPIPL